MDAAAIHQKLAARFGDKITAFQAEALQPWVVVATDAIAEVAAFCKADADLSFENLMCLSAVDYPKETPPRMEMVYHLLSYKHGHTFVLKVHVPRESPAVPTVEGDLGRRQLARARSLRPLRHHVHGPQRPAAHPAPRRLGRASAAQGLGRPRLLQRHAREADGPDGRALPERRSHRRRPVRLHAAQQARGGLVMATSAWEPQDLDTDEMILNMGPQHPSTHGVLRIELRTDGEVVRGARPHIGYLHRCFEKHAENVDYPGVIPYTDRLDYVAAMGNSLGYALTVEKLLNIEVSPYVGAIRVVMAELQRIASHCVAVGTYGMDIGAFTPFLHLLRDREKILDLFEWTCGARLLYNYNWVGGVSHDIPEGFLRACRQFLREFEAITFPELMNLLIGNKIFVKRTAEIGVCSAGDRVLVRPDGPEPARQRPGARPAQGRALLRLPELPVRRSGRDGIPRPAGLVLRPQHGPHRRDGRERQDHPPGPGRPREDGAGGRPREGAEAREAREGRGRMSGARRRGDSSATTSWPTAPG